MKAQTDTEIAWPGNLPERVLVTGGGSGIGRSVALELARNGVSVFVSGRRRERLEDVRRSGSDLRGRILVAPCDVRDAQAVDDLLASIGTDGPITGLVHAAAEVTLSSFETMTSEEFSASVTSTLFGTVNVVKRFGTALLDSGTPGAAVALTSSTCVVGSPGISHSAAGKAGVTAFVRSIAREWGSKGVRINCVAPGTFPVEKSTEMFGDDAVQDHQFERISLGRYGSLPEIVAPVVFMLSSAASYITGQSLVVDGGQTLGDWPIPREVLGRGLNNRY